MPFVSRSIFGNFFFPTFMPKRGLLLLSPKTLSFALKLGPWPLRFVLQLRGFHDCACAPRNGGQFCGNRRSGKRDELKWDEQITRRV